MTMYAEIDNLLDKGEGMQAYEMVKKLLREDKDDVELLWRLAMACHVYGSSLGKKEENKKKELILEGRDAGAAAYKSNEKDFNVVMWAAVLSGEASDYLGTKDRIQEGHKFKEYLDKALTMKPTEYSLLHMRGRFAYTVANLGWLERKAASALFGAPPTATIDEALRDFEETDRLKPQWIENLLFLSRCYIAKGNKAGALKCLKTADGLEAADEGERDLQIEARKLLAKHSNLYK
ncbi:hypothetical protein QR680_013468 [Steinernema hermaphroditum]|uniref:Regulator of microtubule dynamics protein 1 n=1 Tax=Steinernema hermaphroditum TaxID=289476 RepID=A0AA39I5L4_9BILA|nr:hypothetical protein QR680_013468 [Steinernema hermaphroditum]